MIVRNVIESDLYVAIYTLIRIYRMHSHVNINVPYVRIIALLWNLILLFYKLFPANSAT